MRIDFSCHRPLIFILELKNRTPGSRSDDAINRSSVKSSSSKGRLNQDFDAYHGASVRRTVLPTVIAVVLIIIRVVIWIVPVVGIPVVISHRSWIPERI